jgi:hypothetical protein
LLRLWFLAISRAIARVAAPKSAEVKQNAMTTTDGSSNRATRRVAAKPFGQTQAHKLLIKEEALRTLTRQECFDKGYLTVKDLDDEELRYGRCRDESGHIPVKNGKKTVLLPQDKYDEMIAEHELRYKQKLRQRTDEMLDIMVSIAEDDTVEPRDRFEAAKYLFERTAGKTAETVNVNVRQAPWEGLLSDVTGIGSITRAEHRRMTEEDGSAGIIDVEFVDEDSVQPEDVPEAGEDSAEPHMVQVHQPRPEQPAGPTDVPQAPLVRKVVDGEPTFDRDPATERSTEHAPVEVDDPDPITQYGSRRTEAKDYAQQAREAQALAQRRKESRERIQQAKKQRKIDRATGADAIKDEITGATIGEDGKLTFD